MTNADSLPNKLVELKGRVESEERPDIIVVTETKPKNSRFQMCEADFKIEGYDIFQRNINEGHGRGIIIYTNPDLRASKIDTGTYFEEMLPLKIPL